MRSKIKILYALVAVFMLGCKKGSIEPYYQQFVFQGKYIKTGAGINTASFTIDNATLPRQIQIPTNQQPSPSVCQTNRVCLTINNVRLKDELGIYNIEKQADVVTEELRNGKWEQDLENKLSITKTQNLSVVLVLDYSSSLGQDIIKVKQYASSFIDYINQQNNGAKVGIVTFSNTVNTYPPSSNYSLVKNFLNSQPAGADETKLYEAMDAGINLFQNSTAEGKALVTFTDGRNNSWSQTIFSTETAVRNKLNQTIGNPASLISSYTIGLNGKGGIDESTLSALAVNGGISAIAPDADKLEKLFTKFANSVSAIYTMVYNRNASIISNDIQLRFVVNTKLQ
jgi:hypothetical protein